MKRSKYDYVNFDVGFVSVSRYAPRQVGFSLGIAMTWQPKTAALMSSHCWLLAPPPRDMTLGGGDVG